MQLVHQTFVLSIRLGNIKFSIIILTYKREFSWTWNPVSLFFVCAVLMIRNAGNKDYKKPCYLRRWRLRKAHWPPETDWVYWERSGRENRKGRINKVVNIPPMDLWMTSPTRPTLRLSRWIVIFIFENIGYYVLWMHFNLKRRWCESAIDLQKRFKIQSTHYQSIIQKLQIGLIS